MMNGTMGKIRRMALVIGIGIMSILPAGSAFAAGGNQVLMVAPAPMTAPAATPVRDTGRPSGFILSENDRPDGSRCPISESMAADIAMDHIGVNCTSASDVKSVLVIDRNGIPSYEVSFRTREGAYRIKVNAESGRIKDIFFA